MSTSEKQLNFLHKAFLDSPLASVTFAAIGFVIGILIAVVWYNSTKERYENQNILVSSPASSLTKWGTCNSEAGRDLGSTGGCGAAEAFSSRSKFASSAPTENAKEALKRALDSAKRSRFLNDRGAGPQTWNSAAEVDYWANELANPGNVGASSGQTSATLDVSSSTGPVSRFSAGRRAPGDLTPDEMLLLTSQS